MSQLYTIFVFLQGVPQKSDLWGLGYLGIGDKGLSIGQGVHTPPECVRELTVATREVVYYILLGTLRSAKKYV